MTNERYLLFENSFHIIRIRVICEGPGEGGTEAVMRNKTMSQRIEPTQYPVMYRVAPRVRVSGFLCVSKVVTKIMIVEVILMVAGGAGARVSCASERATGQ